ncbi:MAG: formylglycine-generating enzyme family protein, partial [Pirellula sp.]
MFHLDCQVFAQPAKEITNIIGMKLVRIPKGKFMMGSPMSEQGRDERESQHEVVISKNFYMGVHEVTQSQYMK